MSDTIQSAEEFAARIKTHIQFNDWADAIKRIESRDTAHIALGRAEAQEEIKALREQCQKERDHLKAEIAKRTARAEDAEKGLKVLFVDDHSQHGPLVQEEEIVCDYSHCSAGMGVAGMGRCHRGGDPRIKACLLFENEEIALAEYQSQAIGQRAEDARTIRKIINKWFEFTYMESSPGCGEIIEALAATSRLSTSKPQASEDAETIRAGCAWLKRLIDMADMPWEEYGRVYAGIELQDETEMAKALLPILSPLSAGKVEPYCDGCKHYPDKFEYICEECSRDYFDRFEPITPSGKE